MHAAVPKRPPYSTSRATRRRCCGGSSGGPPASPPPPPGSGPPPLLRPAAGFWGAACGARGGAAGGLFGASLPPSGVARASRGGCEGRCRGVQDWVQGPGTSSRSAWQEAAVAVLLAIGAGVPIACQVKALPPARRRHAPPTDSTLPQPCHSSCQAVNQMHQSAQGMGPCMRSSGCAGAECLSRRRALLLVLRRACNAVPKHAPAAAPLRRGASLLHVNLIVQRG